MRPAKTLEAGKRYGINGEALDILEGIRKCLQDTGYLKPGEVIEGYAIDHLATDAAGKNGTVQVLWMGKPSAVMLPFVNRSDDGRTGALLDWWGPTITPAFPGMMLLGTADPYPSSKEAAQDAYSEAQLDALLSKFEPFVETVAGAAKKAAKSSWGLLQWAAVGAGIVGGVWLWNNLSKGGKS